MNLSYVLKQLVLTLLATYDYIIRVVPHLYNSRMSLCRLFQQYQLPLHPLLILFTTKKSPT